MEGLNEWMPEWVNMKEKVSSSAKMICSNFFANVALLSNKFWSSDYTFPPSTQHLLFTSMQTVNDMVDWILPTYLRKCYRAWWQGVFRIAFCVLEHVLGSSQ